MSGRAINRKRECSSRIACQTSPKEQKGRVERERETGKECSRERRSFGMKNAKFKRKEDKSRGANVVIPDST